MSSGASIYSCGCKPPITTENLYGTSCEGSGTIANAAPSQLQSEPQLAMDRLLREYLARKSLGEVKGAPVNYGVPCRHLPRCLIAHRR